MSRTKQFSKAEKEEWKQKNEEREKQAAESINSLLLSFQDDPGVAVEYLMFSSRFPRYSLNNTMLIYRQNPHAVFVQSYKAWKDEGANVKKGEHGLLIRVPVIITYLKTEEGVVQLKYATKQQQLAYRRGEIEGYEKLGFRFGNVFDISQTDFPPEKYPELFQMGYPSEKHMALCEAVRSYSEEKLHIPIRIEDVASISLRGYYNPETEEITISDRLRDTERLSTITHELGHALARHRRNSGKSSAQIEYEGDCISIMLQEHMGVAITDSRKRHLSDHYEVFRKEQTAKYSSLPQEEQIEKANNGIAEAFSAVFQIYAEALEDMKPYLDRVLEPEAEQLQDVRLIAGLSELSEMEAQLLYGEGDSYGIYQLKQEESLCAFWFEGYDSLKEKGLSANRSHYELIYRGELQEEMTLDNLYEIFNTNPPDGFNGHSLSVSDVIVRKAGTETEAFYIDTFGFRKLDDFIPQNRVAELIREEPEEIACRIGDHYLEIFRHEEGFEYTVYDLEYHALDGGVYEEQGSNIVQALYSIADSDERYFDRKDFKNMEVVENYEVFGEQTDYYNQLIAGRTSGMTEPEKGLYNRSRSSIEEWAFQIVETYAYETDLDISVLAARVYGNYGEMDAGQESIKNLDVVVCYQGNLGEAELADKISRSGYRLGGMDLKLHPAKIANQYELDRFLLRSSGLSRPLTVMEQAEPEAVTERQAEYSRSNRKTSVKQIAPGL